MPNAVPGYEGFHDQYTAQRTNERDGETGQSYEAEWDLPLEKASLNCRPRKQSADSGSP